MKMVAEGKGTPMQPRSPLQVYVFALFNENMKPGRRPSVTTVSLSPTALLLTTLGFHRPPLIQRRAAVPVMMALAEEMRTRRCSALLPPAVTTQCTLPWRKASGHG
ncbi:hypothetical protein M5K25_007413 [Dendrobium thyrsiflorum]|uniref:Glucan endo-1,3-beta-D-glucosidase n=1 Tax=Dendrobium thyrsiflorum TaxID=117978 RepID=A0ABD0VE24_DENTH